VPDTPLSLADLEGMRAALDQAAHAARIGEMPVGAVIVRG
jgi:tRNA(Arg) A34 adenosine deaminase TadA